MMIKDILEKARAARGSMVAIGNFDGVHRGHLYLIDQLHKESQRRAVPSTVLTFDPHPRQFFAPESESFQLITQAEKERRLYDSGVDYVITLPFNQSLANMKAHDFIDVILKDNLTAEAIFVGENFRFGYKREGDVEAIKKAGIEVFPIQPYKDEGGKTISSTRVRQAIKAADMKQAKALLGWEWHICGEVVHGDKRGRELGYPTANIWLETIICPECGIYAVEIRRQGKDSQVLHGAASIGIRPMFETRMPILEVFIFDFDEEIYGEVLEVTPVEKIRDELKFDSLDELIDQMAQDCDDAKTILKTR